MNHADSLPVGISVRKLKFTVGVKYQVWEDKHQVSIVQFCSSFQSAFNPGSRMTQICYRDLTLIVGTGLMVSKLSIVCI